MNDTNSTGQPAALPGLAEATGSPFLFEVGEAYETQAGNLVTVIGRTDLKGYECLVCSDGKYRYDRSTMNSDAGRVTGSDRNYSCPDNFKRANAASEPHALKH